MKIIVSTINPTSIATIFLSIDFDLIYRLFTCNVMATVIKFPSINATLAASKGLGMVLNAPVISTLPIAGDGRNTTNIIIIRNRM